ncbi:actinin alpha 2 [Mortierella sp. AM989]|nr:actinin alpha 2 [Mortierella sp. AM989]
MAWQLKNKRQQPMGTGINATSSGSTSHHTPLNSIVTNTSSSNNQAHPELADDVVRTFAASQIDTQKRAFMRWVNVQLASTPYGAMSAIDRDLRDGKRLIGLVEVVAKEPLKPERGNMRIHQMANVSKAIAFLEKKTDEPLGTIGNESIVDGNVKLTLGLIWIIIYRFQIQPIANTMFELYPSLIEDMNNLEGDDSSNVAPVINLKGKKKGTSKQQIDPKQALLRWVRHQLEDYADIIPPIQDFNKSWRTGLAFAALIHRHDPNILPEFYNSILQVPHETVDQWRSTLTTAFDTALEAMNLPRLLDPEDLLDVETPDERSIMTYISEYYLVMSKHEQELDPVIAVELQTQRAQAKEIRLTVAEEDHQAALRRVQEEEERKKQEEQEELERIRLRRLEIEGWSLRAAERAREEEDARRKRREEEEEKNRQRQLRREQRERESAMLLQKTTGRRYSRSALSGPEIHPTDSGISEADMGFLRAEPMDPEELKARQIELDEKLESYLHQSADFFKWLQKKEHTFPETPDITAPLDRTKDVDPFRLDIEQRFEKMVARAQTLTQIHLAREELLDFESPELTSEQAGEVDKIWLDIDASWTSLSDKTSAAKDAIQEMKWVVECSQEIDRILGDIQRFEEQLQAAVEKRSQDTLQDRSQLTLLDHQDTNLITIRAVLRKYTETLSTVLDSNTHTAPEYLSQQKEQVGSELLPQLDSSLVVAQHNLSNDRLLGIFLSTLDLSEEWIQKSAEWLTSLNAPTFVTEDVWVGGDTLKGFLLRDKSHDDNLEQFQSEVAELKAKLDEEQTKVAEFRTNGLEKLDQDAQALLKGVEETNDTTAQETTKAVQDMMHDVTTDLERVEDILPKELNRCSKAMRVLDYLFSVRSVQTQLEVAFNAVNDWVMTQSPTEIEDAVHRVETSRDQLETTFKADDVQPAVWDSIQIRHTALSNLIRDLRSTFDEKHEILKSDQQMKEFLGLSQSCQTTLREFRSQLYSDAPFKGFISEDTTSFDEYATLVANIGQSFDAFESGVYAKYDEMASTVSNLANAPGSRLDFSVIQSKTTSVNRLLNDIKALRVDRERDVVTIGECRRVVGLFKGLNSELGSLVEKFAVLDITDPNQKGTLNDLVEQSNQLANEFVLLEQGTIYRHITRDPSCTPMLKEIKERQISLQQTQSILQSGLEIGEQWNILWDQFTDRVAILQRYLEETENAILSRGIATIDGLADGDSNWKKSEDELHETEVANNQTLSNLKEFQRQRMLELSNLKVALHQAVQLSGGVEALDQIRTRQYHEAEQHQQKLKERFQQLYTLNSKEGFQLEILGQRLVWSQQLVVSKKEVDSSIIACQGIVEKYGRILEKCDETNDTSGAKTAEQLNQQLDQICNNATTQKEATYDVTFTIYSFLADLAVVAAPGETEPVEKKVPLHLEVELYEFKNRYNLLELHLEHARQVIANATQAINLVKKIDSMDNGFSRMAKDLVAEQEANPKLLERIDAIRVELKELEDESQTVIKMPKPADKIVDKYPAPQYQPSRTTLDKILKSRLEHSNQLSSALDPLLAGFMALLAYQDGLRKLAEELNEHDRWITRSGQKVHTTHEQIKQMFSSWPGGELEQMRYQYTEAMVIFDVDVQVVVDDLDVLMAEMDKELIYVQTQKQGFLDSKRKVELALQNATAHSNQLQLELEWTVDNLARQIQQLETDIRTKTLQLQALEKRAIWEKEIEVARSWFKDFAKAVIIFAREQAKWRTNHKEFDDAASMRSVRTTASRMVIDRLGLSVIEFEEQVEIFETESRPSVDKAWSDLCSSLVFIARSVPEEFQYRQNALGQEFEEIRKQVLYSAQIVTQRRSLEEVAFRLEELEGYEGRIGSRTQSMVSGWNGAETKTAKPTKTKEKGWGRRFQAKVKKLARK